VEVAHQGGQTVTQGFEIALVGLPSDGGALAFGVEVVRPVLVADDVDDMVIGPPAVANASQACR
jgi:hypothetical protein